jgi:hypothetical protein
VTEARAAQRYLGGAGVVSAGPDPAAGGGVGAGPAAGGVVGVGLVVSPGEVVVGVDSVGDVELVVCPGDVVVSVGLVVVGVVVSVVVSVSVGRRTLVRGTQV